MEESFSDESLRSRPKEESSDNPIFCLGNCSENWEPVRKSRRLSENIVSHWQSKISEPDEAVNSREEAISNAYGESISSRDNVISDSEVVVPVQESPKDSTIPMVDEVFSQDVHEPVKAVAVSENSKNGITLRMEMVFSPAGHEIAKTEGAEEANYIKDCEITASRCSATAVSETSCEENATLPVEKLPSLDMCELTDEVAGGETTAIYNTTAIDTSDITTSTCNVTAASEFTAAEDTFSEVAITLPLEESSSLDLQESSEVLRTQKPTYCCEAEITASSKNVITDQEHFIDRDEYFEGNVTLRKGMVSSVEADHPEAISMDERTSKDESESAASINDISAAPQVSFAVDGSAEEITLPAENVSSVDVLKPSEAIATDETPITEESDEDVSAAPQVLSAVDGSAEEITEATETDETPGYLTS